MGYLFDLKYWLKRFYRQGPSFYRHLHDLEKSKLFSEERLKTYHNYHFQKMIFHCYTNIPYYQELFFREGLEWQDFNSRKDLEKLPLLDKQTINANYDKLISKSHRNLLCRVG